MEKQFDVVIVGGGVIGLCSAYYLSQSGASVAVMDCGTFEDGASWVNAGLLVPSHVESIAAPGVVTQGIKWLSNPESPFYIKPRFDLDLTKWLWGFQASCTEENVERSIPLLRDLALESLVLHAELNRLSGFEGIGLSNTGLLMLHNSSDSKKANLELADVARDTGLNVVSLSREETLAREPAIATSITGSVFFSQDQLFDPERFMASLIAEVASAGVVLMARTTVESFVTRGSHVSAVITDAGPVSCNELVLAAGSWTGLLADKLGLKVPMQPGMGYSITAENPSSDLKIPLVLTDERISVTPMPGRLRVGGTMTLVGFDSTVDPVRIRPLERVLRSLCPETADDQNGMPAARSGFRPCTVDGLPAIGRSAKCPNVIVAAGHCMLGMTQGPITGKLVSEISAGRTPSIDLTLLSPDRF